MPSIVPKVKFQLACDQGEMLTYALSINVLYSGRRIDGE